jgi:hypothetical protein
MKAYKGYVTAISGLLIGGSKRHESYAFENEQDALAWAQTAYGINERAHRHVSLPKVKVINHPKPIKRSEIDS